MNQKITRRVVLGTIIGGLSVLPFVTRHFLKKRIYLEPNSFLSKFRSKYQGVLSFPHEYKPFINEQLAEQPKYIIEKILKYQKMQWENFSKLDEAEFDYSNYDFDEKGNKRKGDWLFEGHVRMKYGYGIEIVGKNVENKPFHWIFNLDGDISSDALQMNLSSLMLHFFMAYRALPQIWKTSGLAEENVVIPENPYFQGSGKYDVLLPWKESYSLPRKIADICFSRSYINTETGMTEFVYAQSVPDPYSKLYENENYAIPPIEKTYYVRKYIPINGVYLPTNIVSYYSNGSKHTETYDNIKIKLHVK
ncbi:MAG: hypothetical protein LBJ67_01710 [Planctomycetaceae bacterium]|jgi:hypothetical protein|nr:hypothetical protein [Planctomycetaceae bacterium]